MQKRVRGISSECGPLLSRAWSVGVVIPARDEEDRIEQCIESVVGAIQACPNLRRAFVVLVADSRADLSLERARHRLMGQGIAIKCSAASAGVARRLGVERGLEHFGRQNLSRLWVANTDADSRVSRHWLERQLQLGDRDYCAVAWIVSLDSRDLLSGELVTAWSQDHRLYPDGTHPHVHGANLGFRVDAYLNVGGWSSLPLGKDHCLWGRLRGHRWPAIASSVSVVTTRGRLTGRARGGFADSLRYRMYRLSGLIPLGPHAEGLR